MTHIVSGNSDVEFKVKAGLTVRQLNVLHKSKVHRVNSQVEVRLIIQCLFQNHDDDQAIFIHNWSATDFGQSITTDAIEKDHELLNLISELSFFKDIDVVLQMPRSYLEIKLIDNTSETDLQERQLQEYLSRWRQIAQYDKAT